MAPSILDLSPAEARSTIDTWVAAHALPGYRTDQILRRLWIAPIGSWSDATELPGTLREALAKDWPLLRLTAASVEVSADGTKKYLWRLADREAVESVLIPSGTRRTLCISSQAGCALGCVFCATGRMGFRRNLSGGEIAAQAREIILANPDDRPTNIVFMGMGEPLLNWPAVDTALTILNDAAGLGIGARHITVSTVGILPGMDALRNRPEQFRLAISLHSANPDARIRLMPIEQKYPLDQVLASARRFGRRVTFEYVMIRDRNDSDHDADQLAAIAKPLGAHVNLLPLHPGGGDGLVPSSGNRIRIFAERLKAAGIEAVVRRSRGLDINAACGQLYVEMEAKRRRAAKPAPTG
ncbi:MAG: 23S rRNA (adenine(2503)-C(2))-methyltransferase RlmN [Gemmatimonadetes bacterium]|nr:23S rRNA (adenine(2503)-C(2))-methyltransferase RlmN [Gemmatimonadota bacterium]